VAARRLDHLPHIGNKERPPREGAGVAMKDEVVRLEADLKTLVNELSPPTP
jgi:hypothetical protein